MSDDIAVGTITKPAVRRPTPRGESAAGAATERSAAPSTEEGIAALNDKMDQLIKFMQAIDWKMWVYLKANNYID